MSYSITVNHVNAPAVPRGAQIVSALYDAFHSFMFTPPRARSRMEEAAAVRELARQMQDVDPSFAADLYAAACRHEGD